MKCMIQENKKPVSGVWFAISGKVSEIRAQLKEIAARGERTAQH